jgi:serine/threonine protein phosphatase 1
VTGIGRVFVGHSPQWNGIARLGNVYLVDTGGVFALLGRHPEGRLTLAETVMETGALLAPTLPQLVDVRFGDCPPVIPFGNYATSRSAATLAHAC